MKANHQSDFSSRISLQLALVFLALLNCATLSAQTPISIDHGRQLFIDDYVIQTNASTLTRTLHQAVYGSNNPVLTAQWQSSEFDLGSGQNGNLPGASTFGDGVWFDPVDNLYKMFYCGGWYDGTCLVLSTNGINWVRPNLPVVPGSNRVLPTNRTNTTLNTGIFTNTIGDVYYRDGGTVWLDQFTSDPSQRFKMLLDNRLAGNTLQLLYSSPDGVNWTNLHLQDAATLAWKVDNSSFFYDPFRQQYVISYRVTQNGRARLLVPGANWFNLFNNFTNPPYDKPFTPYPLMQAITNHDNTEAIVFPNDTNTYVPGDGTNAWGNSRTELYDYTAAAYESLMLGFYAIIQGPSTDQADTNQMPKLLDIKLGYSRDGTNYIRFQQLQTNYPPLSQTNYPAFVSCTRALHTWNRGYLHPAGGGCLIVGDQLRFYFGAFSGDNPNGTSALYAGGSTGYAVLRRDGFASLDAGAGGGTMTTLPITFTGKFLFVNVDATSGTMQMEILDTNGNVIAPFSAANCNPISATSSTRQRVSWQGASDLSALTNTPVLFKFYLTNGSLYSFWVSAGTNGASQGYVAAGGPGFTGPTDTVGSDAVMTVGTITNSLLGVVAPPTQFLWAGSAGSAWDINTTTNWQQSGVPQTYQDGQAVVFDDTASSFAVTLTTNLQPASVVVTNTAPGTYVFGGSGKLTGATSLTKSGSGSLTLTTLNDYTGFTALKNGKLTINALNSLPATTALALGDSNAPSTAGSLDLSSFSQSISTLTVQSAGSATNVITIGNGNTLTGNGIITIGPNATNVNSYPTILNVSGLGTWSANGGNGIFQIGQSASGTGDVATADFSGLANLYLTNFSQITIGDRRGASPGTLLLGSNSVISTGEIDLGFDPMAVETLLLGSGSNFIGGSIRMCVGNSGYGTVKFQGANGSLALRGRNGGSVRGLIQMQQANVNGGASSAVTNLVDLRGHYADVLLTELRLATLNTAGTLPGRSGIIDNRFFFDQGILDCTDILIGLVGTNPSDTNLVSIGGGLVNVDGPTGIHLSGVGPGTLSIGGGTVNLLAGGIVKDEVVTPTSFAYLTLNSTNAASPAILDLHGQAIGDGTYPLDYVQFISGTLQNLAQFNGGANLVKTGTGSLTLAGTNTYTGGTIVSNGTLNVTGSIAGGSVTVTAGTTLTGSGIIQGSVTVSGTLSPGPAVGTLIVSNTLTLNSGSQTFMKLNKSAAANDTVSGLTQVFYGGTLTVTNLSGSLLGGDKFTLFSAATRNGAFSTVNLPPLLPGLAWANQLAADGSIAVTGSVIRPPLLVQLTNTSTLRFTWPANYPGFSLQTQTNAPGIGLGTNWVNLPGATNSPVLVPIPTGVGSVFFRLQLQ